MPRCMGYKTDCCSIETKYNGYCLSCHLEIVEDRVRELEQAIRACRDCNDNGEQFSSPTPDSAQCMANLFSLVD